jgi:hypothetical protein
MRKETVTTTSLIPEVHIELRVLTINEATGDCSKGSILHKNEQNSGDKRRETLRRHHARFALSDR